MPWSAAGVAEVGTLATAGAAGFRSEFPFASTPVDFEVLVAAFVGSAGVV